MKFALVALIATASAIKITASGAHQCVPSAASDKVFDEVDTNHNGQVSKKELTVAMTAGFKKYNFQPTKEEVAKFTAAAEADAGADHTLSPAEFNTLAN